MESSVERALKRAGHKTRLLDDRRTKRLIGRKLTQQWILRRAHRFKPDFIFLSKCLALSLDTVRKIIGDTPNAMWYHDPQWHSATDRPDSRHSVVVGELRQTRVVSGADGELRA